MAGGFERCLGSSDMRPQPSLSKKGKIMRMWNIQPKLLCRRHLLGEHVEMHMFAGCVSKGKSLVGYIEKGLVEIGNIINRHDELALEMVRRGYKHNSKCQHRDAIQVIEGRVYVGESLRELAHRCPECRLRQEGKKT